MGTERKVRASSGRNTCRELERRYVGGRGIAGNPEGGVDGVVTVGVIGAGCGGHSCGPNLLGEGVGHGQKGQKTSLQ